MEESEFKQAYQEATPLPCVFEKAILLRCCGCGQCRRVYIAEREGVACTQHAAHQRCQIFLRLLHEKSRFALHLTEPQVHLPHAKLLKLQCGGIQGVQHVLATDAEPPTSCDIAILLKQAWDMFDEYQNLPYGSVVGFITRFKGRTRHRRRISPS